MHRTMPNIQRRKTSTLPAMMLIIPSMTLLTIVLFLVSLFPMIGSSTVVMESGSSSGDTIQSRRLPPRPTTMIHDETDEEDVKNAEGVTVDLYTVSSLLRSSDTTTDDGTITRRRLWKRKKHRRNHRHRRSPLSVPSIVCRIITSVLTNRITHRWTSSESSPHDLKIKVQPSSLTSSLVSLFRWGQIQADADLSSGPIIFDSIRFSSVQLVVEHVTLNLFSLLGTTFRRVASAARFPQPLQVQIHELTMSRQDVMASPCIRNGLRRLLRNILHERYGLISNHTMLHITSVDILPTGKLAIQGETQTKDGQTLVPFEIRTGLAVDATGHVLQFPGLEVSVLRDYGWFVPFHAASWYYNGGGTAVVELDVGPHTQFHSIVVDGRTQHITIGARLLLNTASSSSAARSALSPHSAAPSSSAHLFYDIGRGLSRLGNFAH